VTGFNSLVQILFLQAEEKAEEKAEEAVAVEAVEALEMMVVEVVLEQHQGGTLIIQHFYAYLFK
jgi:hypothetical protein